MKNGMKQAAGCLLFLALLAVILAGLAHLFQPKNNREDFGMGEMKANGILTEAGHSLDVVAIGDSECALAIAPMVMWREQGIPSYNCGTAGAYLYEVYHYLAQAFERQQPKVVILETNVIFKECKLSDYLFSKLERVVPLLRYHDRWKNLRAEDFGPVEYTWSDEYKGHMFYTDAEASAGRDYMTPSEEVRRIARWGHQSLKEIVKLCEKNGAELLLLSTPSEWNWNYANHNGIQALADEFGLTYVDMNLLNEEIKINWQTDTKDAGDHMNIYGAEKVSGWLGRYLVENYGLTDRRGEALYAPWEKDLAVYQEAWEKAQK